MNGLLMNTSGSIALAVNYTINGPYTDKFLDRQDTKTIRLNADVFIKVGNAILFFDSDVDIDESNLDVGSNYSPSTSYNIYACHPLDGSGIPVVKTSENSSYPSGGWNGDNSRKIGGFNTDGSGNIAASGNGLWDLRTVDVTHTGVTDSMIPADEISPSKIKLGSLFTVGANTFAGDTGKTITHNLGHQNYKVAIIPTADPDGYLGDVHCIKADNTVVVYNSGDADGAFEYLIINYAP
jgi:hypothetical protein